MVHVNVANLEDGGHGNQETLNVVVADILIALITDDDWIKFLIISTELLHFNNHESTLTPQSYFFTKIKNLYQEYVEHLYLIFNDLTTRRGPSGRECTGFVLTLSFLYILASGEGEDESSWSWSTFRACFRVSVRWFSLCNYLEDLKVTDSYIIYSEFTQDSIGRWWGWWSKFNYHKTQVFPF